MSDAGRCDRCGVIEFETIEVKLGAFLYDYCRECWDNLDESAPEPEENDYDRGGCPGCGGSCWRACR